MESEEAPRPAELLELADRREEPSISIQLASSHNPAERGPVRIQFKNLVAAAEAKLDALDVPKRPRTLTLDRLAALKRDDDFWQTPGGLGLAIFATPTFSRAFRLVDPVPDRVTVGDRLDFGALLRDDSSRDRALVLALTREHVRMLVLTRGGPPIELPVDLPDDIGYVFVHANNEGDADMPRAAGPEGEQPEEHKYCRAVQDAVLARIGDRTHPLVLASSEELEPAYRAINTYEHLVGESAGFNPSYKDAATLEARAWEILDDHKESRMAEWRELFGTRRSNGHAVSGVKEVALAATAAAVDELVFDVDTVIEGTVDSFGVVHIGESVEPPVYNVIDEIAARVLRSGGALRPSRDGSMLDGAPVAAMLRFPVPVGA